MGDYCGSLEREEVRGICNLNTLNVGEWIMEWKVNANEVCVVQMSLLRSTHK